MGFLIFRDSSANKPQEAEVGKTEEKAAESSQAETNRTQEKSEESILFTNNTQVKNGLRIITIETDKGVIKFETYDADAPKTVENFITLAEKGFYNGLTFHRIAKGFVIQGGDPNRNGTGGPGYKFEDELNSETPSYKEGYKKGVVAMANAGPNTNGSQFFIMLADVPLPHKYTIFGKVIAGQDVVGVIGLLPTAGETPLVPVVMKKVSVEEKK